MRQCPPLHLDKWRDTLGIGEFVLGEEVAGIGGGVDGEQVVDVVHIALFEGVEECVSQLFLGEGEHSNI